MKKQISVKKILAFHTGNPGRIADLIKNSEAVAIPQEVQAEGADLVMTVLENMPKDKTEREQAEIIASYIMRYASQALTGGECKNSQGNAKVY